MKRKKIFAGTILLLISISLSAQESLQNQKSTTEKKVSENTNFFNSIPRKIDSEFYLTSNFAFAFGFNYTNQANYPFLKLNIDIMEAWFGRLGVSSVLGFDIGFDPKQYSTIIAQLICPGLDFSWDFGAGLYFSAGINLLHTWHYYNVKSEVSSRTISTGILNETVDSRTQVATIRSYGLSFPIKIRYLISKHITVYGEYIFAFHPWIPDDKNWIIENTLNAGVSFSLPINF